MIAVALTPTETAGTTTVMDSSTGWVPDEPSSTSSSTTNAPSSTTDEGGLDLPPPAFAVTLTASTQELKRAGSIVLTAEFEGEPKSLELRVVQDGLAIDLPEWPLGESTLEYKVMSEDLNGDLTFKLSAEDDRGFLADDSLQVQLDLPEHGSLDLRLVATGDTPTRGTALALIPGTGTEPDEVMIVGTQNETELLFAEIHGGELWTSPAHEDEDEVEAQAMHPTGLVADGQGNTFVAGYDGEDMILRKYSRFRVVIWEHRISNARANDLVLGPYGLLYVAGVTTNGDDTDATVWVSNESGSLQAYSFSHLSPNNQPLGSELHGVAFDGGEPVFAGFAEHPEFNLKPERGALFQLSGNMLALRTIHELPDIEEQSGWRGLVKTPLGLVTVGWHRHGMDSSHLAQAHHGEDFTENQFAISWPGEGSKVVWHPAGYSVVGGERVVNEEPHLLVHRDSWAPYVDDDSGRAHDLLIDRHGYIYFTGEAETEGVTHLVVGRIHP